MFGDSFCKSAGSCRVRRPSLAFNPHVWGLFLQEKEKVMRELKEKLLSIPMFGDSFCKDIFSPSFQPMDIRTFNPHVWGLFLQADNEVRDNVAGGIGFQSPCLGTLFASYMVTAAQ